MSDDKNKIIRNEPSEKGSSNDPNVRDYSAIQPGVQSVSSSDTDKSNENLTSTGADSISEQDNNGFSDPKFDDARTAGE
jgi:hypothetical protein